MYLHGIYQVYIPGIYTMKAFYGDSRRPTVIRQTTSVHDFSIVAGIGKRRLSADSNYIRAAIIFEYTGTLYRGDDGPLNHNVASCF